MRLAIPFLLCALAGSAVADRKLTPEQREQARLNFEKGKELYARGDYKAAAAEYLASYKLTLFPELLFNIGQAYRLAGDAAEALNAYNMYLQASPQGDLADESRIRVLELRSAKSAEPAPPVVAYTPPYQPDAPLGVQPEAPPPRDEPVEPEQVSSYLVRKQRSFAFGLDTAPWLNTETYPAVTTSLSFSYVQYVQPTIAIEPRLLIGRTSDSHEGSIIDSEVVIEVQARAHIYPGGKSFFFGGGIGLGIAGCEGVSFDESYITPQCEVGVIGSLYAEAGFLIANHIELSLALHPFSVLDQAAGYSDETGDNLDLPLRAVTPLTFSAAYRL